MRVLNLPTMLTLIRLIVSPLMLPVLLVYLLPYDNLFINSMLALLFIALSLTDLFDGFLARRFNQVTKLGKQLDPLADKFLSYCALISLLAANKIFFYWVIILIGRDFFVMGLRAIAKEKDFSIPVSFFSKIKTTAQMIFIGFVILNPYQKASFTSSWNLIEYGLLAVVLLLTVFSAKIYYDSFRKNYGPFDSLFGEKKSEPESLHSWFDEEPPVQG